MNSFENLPDDLVRFHVLTKLSNDDFNQLIQSCLYNKSEHGFLRDYVLDALIERVNTSQNTELFWAGVPSRIRYDLFTHLVITTPDRDELYAMFARLHIYPCLNSRFYGNGSYVLMEFLWFFEKNAHWASPIFLSIIEGTDRDDAHLDMTSIINKCIRYYPYLARCLIWAEFDFHPCHVMLAITLGRYEIVQDMIDHIKNKPALKGQHTEIVRNWIVRMEPEDGAMYFYLMEPMALELLYGLAVSFKNKSRTMRLFTYYRKKLLGITDSEWDPLWRNLGIVMDARNVLLMDDFPYEPLHDENNDPDL